MDEAMDKIIIMKDPLEKAPLKVFTKTTKSLGGNG